MSVGKTGSDSVSRSSSSGGLSDGGVSSHDEVMERGAWGSKVEFILTCIGYAVGLGNVWRFPYLVFENGGGAFVIAFAIMLAIIGIPIFFMEVCWGQFASRGAIAIWSMNPLLKGLGVSMIFTELMVGMYYNVIISWCLYFLFASMTDELPWATCNNPWNTIYCMETVKFANLTENVTLSDNITVVTKGELKTPSDEYFYRKVLQMNYDMDDSGTVVWQLALCLLLSWITIFCVLIKGIGSLGKVVYVTSIFPYILLTIMLIRGVTLDGAGEGIDFYLNPNWSALGELQVWNRAATQMFYALNTCTGGLLAMSSFSNFRNNSLRDAFLVPVVNVLTSIYAGFAIFSVLGYMAKLKGVEVKDVAASGPGLVFVVYPEGLTTMPVSPLWSILFFMMMLMLGWSSMFSMCESFFSSFMDEYPNILRKNYYRTVMFRATGCVVFYLISLPMVTNTGFYVFTIWDKFTGDFPLLFIGFIEIIAIMYIYGFKNFAYDIEMMLGSKLVTRICVNFVFRACWMLLTPAVVMGIIVLTIIDYTPPESFDRPFPPWGEAFGWSLVTFILISTPGVFIYQFIKRGGRRPKDLYRLTRPTPEWGPADPADRTGKYAVNNGTLVHRKVHPAPDSASSPDTEFPAVNGSKSNIETGAPNAGVVGFNNQAFSQDVQDGEKL